ncbi:high nitrogen upregulated cytochrome P450 monooxygenase 2 [Lentinus tigrinus ALCF2SS1-7]|uniref:high nitrogen upregulated cytochrome P450 monooxygenase 2 n=1 Tax=Lentinus tigrinus ALCF2SS1-7 TaxID=1328758 RepID=UPI001165EC8F|nr:high nitrogen upregulated cytochrome P450 monooxygenase 2 [Lentinus tigrinus ALCF2SS1-7]
MAVHQLFRTRETYRVSAHLALLLGPPTLLVIVDGYRTTLLPASNSLLSYYFTYLSALVASVVLYRISPFHPLWPYPGPFWCRTTMFWHAAVAATGEQPRYLQRLHDKYGDIVRFGPNNLSIRDPSLVGPLMGSSGVGKGPNFVGAMLTETNVPMVGIADTDEHIRRRRAWTRGLGPAALKEFEHLIVRRAHQLVDQLGEQKGVVNIGKWINYFSYDLMSDMTFGGGSELLQEGDKTNVWHVIEEGVVPATFLAQVPWLGLYVARIPAAMKALDAFLQLGKDFAMRRIEKGSTTPDLFHYLNNEDLPDKPQPPLQQLVDDGILAIVAGADTVSSAMTSLFHCLLTHPETYRKLQEEVDKYYPQGEDAFNSKHYRDMTYLQAVIHEATRLYPPIMTSSPRKVPNDASGVAIGSLYLPPGTSILIPPFSLHRDARNFTFPDSFWPERWLVASGQLALADAPLPRPIPSLSFESSPSRKSSGPSNTLLPTSTSHGAHTLAESEFAHNDSAFLAFSHGPMNCVGKGLGMQEMRTVVTAIMQRYEMRLREGWDAGGYEAEYRDYFVSTRPEVPVLLERRG